MPATGKLEARPRRTFHRRHGVLRQCDELLRTQSATLGNDFLPGLKIRSRHLYVVADWYQRDPHISAFNGNHLLDDHMIGPSRQCGAREYSDAFPRAYCFGGGDSWISRPDDFQLRT